MTTTIQALILSISMLLGCNNSPADNGKLTGYSKAASSAAPVALKRHFKGAFNNGMKGDSISFDISPDGKKLENLIFNGYWRCSGKLERTVVGPDGSFTIANNQVNEHISEPPNGGSTAWRFELQTNIKGKSASGTFRMNINNLGCDTYKLKFTAQEVAKK
jgi:hypothetical protein